MSRYEKYKPSGIDWIGEVPLDWEIKKLKHILLGVNSGDGISKNDMEEDGEFEIYGGNGVMGYTNKYNSEGEVIVIGRVGAKCGVTYLLDKNLWISDNALQTRTYQNYKYLFYLLVAVDFNQYANQNAQPLITGTIVKNFPIPFVINKDEQLAIANYLDDQTQKIDRLITNKKAQAEKLKELRQIEINNAVTKGLNPNVEMKDSGIEWLGKIPKHWEVKKIKQLLKPEKNAIKTGPFGSDLKFEDLIEEGIKVYNQRSVLDNDWKSGEGYISAEKYESLKTCTIFPNDIVITTRGTIGKVSIFPSDAELGILHPCLMRIQMNSQRILNDYLKIIINDSSFFFEALKLASNATTIDVIYSDSLKEVKIPVPPTNDQIEITTYLQKRISAIEQLIKNIDAQIEKLQELRKIKIYEAVTGKIKVNGYEKRN